MSFTLKEPARKLNPDAVFVFMFVFPCSGSRSRLIVFNKALQFSAEGGSGRCFFITVQFY